MSIRKRVADIRTDYKKDVLHRSALDPDPIQQFEKWFMEAEHLGFMEVNSMGLATVSNGRPSLRIVLLKGFDERGFVFYTNYESRKAKELLANPWAALTFFWAPLERQVHIEGRVKKVSAEESDEYFHSRDRGSRIGAWSSSQSQVLPNREALEAKVAETAARFEGQETIPRPDNWGGYRVIPDQLEFWQGRESRLHDRFVYQLQEDGSWQIDRLSP
jgi:pyridoxamine 5'-phosphate oxidase